MNLSRTLVALLASVAVSGATASAAPPADVNVGAGAHGGIGIGGPPIGVPPVQVPPMSVPPVNAPPVNVPKPQTSLPPANANAQAHANANASIAGANVLHGTLTKVNRTTVTIVLPNGSSRTLMMSSRAAANVHSLLGKPVVFQVNGGTVMQIAQGTPPLHGTLVSVTGTTATVKFANGTTQTYTLTAQQAARLQARAGHPIAFWTAANGTIELDQRSHMSSAGQHHAVAKNRSRAHAHGRPVP